VPDCLLVLSSLLNAHRHRHEQKTTHNPPTPHTTPPPTTTNTTTTNHQQQDKERAFLKESFARVQTLEAQRVKLTQAVAASLSDGYSRALTPLPQAAAALAPAISGIDGEAELAELHRVALDTGSAAEALAARQAQSIEDASSDLFCSPEILRQGPMQIWDGRGSAWGEAHCVLTRAGFLHWFKSMEAPEPLDVLNLGECWARSFSGGGLREEGRLHAIVGFSGWSRDTVVLITLQLHLQPSTRALLLADANTSMRHHPDAPRPVSV